VLDAFGGAGPANGDIAPCGGGDGAVDLDDILSVLDAFAGDACPHPCPPLSDCGNMACTPPENQCNCVADCGAPPSAEGPGAACADGIDNDCDGAADCGDCDCEADTACATCVAAEVPGMTCLDGNDNDCDGATDCADSDCCVADPGCGLCDGDIVPLPCGNGVVNGADLQAVFACLNAATPPAYCDVNSDGAVDVRDACDVHCQLNGGGAGCCSAPEGACCGLFEVASLDVCEEIPAACCAWIGQQAQEPDNVVYEGDGTTCAPGCCGDGTCNNGETACDCLQDCGFPPSQEFPSGGNPTCGDLLDNDCDNLIDCADPDCEHAVGCPCTTDAECQILDDSVCHCEICDNGVCVSRQVSPGDIDCRSRDNFCVDLNDILCVLNGFAVFAVCPNGDQASPDCAPDGVIDLNDILFVLDAFGGEFDKATCNCPDCISACLLPDGTCDDLTEGDCCTMNGCWRPFEICATTIITQACTTALGACEDVTVAACAGAPYYGTAHGAGTCCFQTSVIGACCLPSGCMTLSHIDCLDMGGCPYSGNDCGSVDCMQPCDSNSCPFQP